MLIGKRTNGYYLQARRLPNKEYQYVIQTPTHSLRGRVKHYKQLSEFFNNLASKASKASKQK